MNKCQKKFLFYLEHYYRNYGDTWKMADFPNDITKNILKVMPILDELEKKSVIKFSDDKSVFRILRLPSESYDPNIFIVDPKKTE